MSSAIDKTETNGCACALIKLYLHKQAAGWIWPVGSSLMTPGLREQYALPQTSHSPSSGSLFSTWYRQVWSKSCVLIHMPKASRKVKNSPQTMSGSIKITYLNTHHRERKGEKGGPTYWEGPISESSGY